MENLDNELRKVIQELADEEGISFADAIDVSIKVLRYEVERRKSFTEQAACGGSGATS